MTAHVQSNWWATTLNDTCRGARGQNGLVNPASWRHKCVISVDERRTKSEKDKGNTQKESAKQQKNSIPRQARIVKGAGATKTWGTMKRTQEHPPPCQVMHADVGFMLHPLVDAAANSRKERVQQNRDHKGPHDHPLPGFEKQCQVMHAEVGFMLHPLVDAAANSRKERVQQNRDHKGPHDHPLPGFEKQCQVMHAEVGFTLHPLADSEPQTSAAEKYGYKDKTQKVEKNEIDMKQGFTKGTQGNPPTWFETHCQVVNAER